MTDLFSPLQAGALAVPNRVWMAPLTRCRADAQNVPTPMMAEHYAQRASAGLIVAEATMLSPGHGAFGQEPAIFSAEQVAGWARVTQAVHAAGGRIVLQLWHGGRACHPMFNDGRTAVAPSAVAIEDQVYTPAGQLSHPVPRALRDDELPGIVATFAHAAGLARDAGFDGVEVHGANGYLLDQFLRDGSNHREGPYGGVVSNRARLMLEVLDAVCGVWGGDRVGLRLSPLNSYNSMSDSDPVGLVTWLAERLNSYGLAYLHLMRGDFFGRNLADVMTPVRAHYRGVLVGNMGYSGEEAQQAIASGQLDAVAFGTAFLANPDLPARLRAGAALNPPDPNTFYSHGAEGYTDYPAMAA